MFGVQKLRIEKAPKQKGGKDCGVLAIATYCYNFCTLWIGWCNGLYLFQ